MVLTGPGGCPSSVLTGGMDHRLTDVSAAICVVIVDQTVGGLEFSFSDAMPELLVVPVWNFIVPRNLNLEAKFELTCGAPDLESSKSAGTVTSSGRTYTCTDGASAKQ